MKNRAVLVATMVVAMSLTVACGGDDDDSSNLQPASTVLSARSATAEATAVKAEVLKLGDSADLDFGLKATVSAVERDIVFTSLSGRPEPTSATTSHWALTVRFENTGKDDVTPDVTVLCDGGETGRWAVRDATFLQKLTVPSKSFLEGKVLLDVPQGCVNPRASVKPAGVVYVDRAAPTATLWSLQ